jgi:hypothetical protein
MFCMAGNATPTPKPEDSIMSFSEFMKGSEKSTAFQEVLEDLRKEKRETLTGGNRRDEEWGLLANQVVGKETI